MYAANFDRVIISVLPRSADPTVKTSWDFVEFMLAGAVSKTVASSIAYPHGEYPSLTIRSQTSHATPTRR